MVEVEPTIDYREDAKLNPARYAGEFFKTGDFTRGWKLYSHREKNIYGIEGRKGLGIPAWQGQDLKGKTLVLAYEQTLGEHILFCSFIPELLAMGAKLTVEVDFRLISLLKRSFPEVNFVPWQYPWHPDVYKGDYYTLLGNPGKYLRPNIDAFKHVKPYLKPSNTIQNFNLWPVIGISWWSIRSPKNIDFDDFSPLTDDLSISCVNLQYGIDPPKPIFTYQGIDLNNDFDGIANIIADCDAVVTISTVVAHIAGAMGKPTYVLLPKSKYKHWYWSLPFYRNVHTIIKDDDQQWKDIINKIKLDIT